MIRRLKDKIKKMQYGKYKKLLAIIATMQQSILHRKIVYIYLDNEGKWHNKQAEYELVSPELNVSSPVELIKIVDDYWQHDYHIRLGDTVIDVGAGIGDQVLVFSKLVGKKGRVIAIEAHPDTYDCLIKTVQLSRLSNVICINAAVTLVTQNIKISDNFDYLGNTIIAVEENGREVCGKSFLDIMSSIGINHADFMKMNIEGAEREVVEGLAATKNVISIQNLAISCHDFKAIRGEGELFKTYSGIWRILEGLGYNLRKRKIDKNRPELEFYIYAKIL